MKLNYKAFCFSCKAGEQNIPAQWHITGHVGLKPFRGYVCGGGANLNGLKDYINIKLSSQAELLINKINHDLDLSSNLMSDFYICYGMIRHHIEGIPSEVLPSQNKSKGILSTILSIF